MLYLGHIQWWNQLGAGRIMEGIAVGEKRKMELEWSMGYVWLGFEQMQCFLFAHSNQSSGSFRVWLQGAVPSLSFSPAQGLHGNFYRTRGKCKKKDKERKRRFILATMGLGANLKVSNNASRAFHVYVACMHDVHLEFMCLLGSNQGRGIISNSGIGKPPQKPEQTGKSISGRGLSMAQYVCGWIILGRENFKGTWRLWGVRYCISDNESIDFVAMHHAFCT